MASTCSLGIKNQVALFVEGKPWFVYDGQNFIEVINSPADRINETNKAGVASDTADLFNEALNKARPVGKVFYVVEKPSGQIGIEINPTINQLGIIQNNEEREVRALLEQEDVKARQKEFTAVSKEKFVSDRALREQDDKVAFYRSESESIQDVVENSVPSQQAVQDNLNSENSDNTRAREIASKLSDQLNQEFEIITPAEAIDLLKDTKTPWNGEAAFYIGSKVYFVGDNLTIATVLHEFAHPLVRNIARNNKALFNNLYKTLEQTAEGAELIDTVKKLYPELDPASELFKEEVIVRAIEKEGTPHYNESSTGFKKFIKDLMYALKQMLRRVFGQKSNVSKLSPNTTLESLTEMLTAGENFHIETEIVTDEDIAAFKRQSELDLQDMMTVQNESVQTMINSVYKQATSQLRLLRENGQYTELANLLTDQFKAGELEQLQNDLVGYQSLIIKKVKKFEDQAKYENDQAQALVNAIYRLNNVMIKIEAHLQEIGANPKTQNDVGRAHYYDHIIEGWNSFVLNATEMLAKHGKSIPTNSPIVQTIGSIKTNVDRSKAIINEIYKNGARDTLYETLLPMGADIKERYESLIKNLEDRKAPQKIIDRWYKEYHGLTKAELKSYEEFNKNKNSLTAAQRDEFNRLKRLSAEGVAITKEKIENTLLGEAGDANYFNAYLEGYMYSADPIIGGLALYVKNKMNEVMATVQGKYNDFNADLAPSLKKIGSNPSNIGALGKRMGFIDQIGYTKEDGSFGIKEIWSLLSKFQNFRAATDKLDYDVDKAHGDWVSTGDDQDRKRLVQAIGDRKKHKRQWFHQEYTEEYYKREALLEDDEVGQEASYRKDNILEDIAILQSGVRSEQDALDILPKLDEYWAQYKQHFSLYDTNGVKKTGLDLSVAERLLRYREMTRDFASYIPREGAFENALANREQELINQKILPTDPAFKILMDEWKHANTRVKIKDQFYTDRDNIINEIKTLLTDIKGREELDVSEIWEEILNKVTGFRDEDGQLRANEMNPNIVKDVKALQKEIEKRQQNVVGKSGLTPVEQARLKELQNLKEQDGTLSVEDGRELSNLYDKRADNGLSKIAAKRLEILYKQLQQLSRKEPNEYYVKALNDFLEQLDTTALKQINNGHGIIHAGNANIIFDENVLQNLFAQGEIGQEFEKWFNINHMERSYFAKGGVKVDTWERVYVWNVIKPNDPKYIEKTILYDELGNVKDEIEGIPVLKYYSRVVNEEFKYQPITGIHVDNKGNFLPKDVANSPYRNDKYYNLNQDEKTVLEKLTKHHLMNQEGLDRKSKLYLDFPRFGQTTLEELQSKNVKNATGEKWNALTNWAKRTKGYLTGMADEAQRGLNENDKFNIIRVDMFDNSVTGVPIAGIYDLEAQLVSTNITETMMRYMLSAERQKQLIKISPVARAIQSVVKNNDPVPLNHIGRKNFITKTIQRFRTTKAVNIRAKAVSNLIEREFEGQNVTGITKDWAWLNNLQGTLFKRASFGFFALNIPSALKNMMGAKFQGMIEAAAGQHMNMKDFALAEGQALSTMTQISGQIYKRGPRSLDVQLVELMDPSQGRFEEKLGENLSRTLTQDTVSMSWMYNFRKWTELEATLQIFYGMMNHQKVEQTDKAGNVTKISYSKAWTVVNGKIQLKEGVDPAWGITYNGQGEMLVGEKYNKFRNKMHQVQNNLQGAYSKFDQPEAQRYLAFRFLSYLQRYFTPMFVNRWAFGGKWHTPRPRQNPGLGDVQMGYYTEFLRFLKNTVFDLGKNIPYMVPSEKRAAIKVLTEVMALILVVAVLGLLFGWDPDDPDRYKKLRAKSGALPFPMTNEDPNRPFNGWGFLENHALLLMLNIRAENEQFLPFPNFGSSNYSSMLDLKSIAFKPTVQTYMDLVDHMYDIIAGNEKGYYQKKVGPYKWQEAGSPKIWASLFRVLGLSGSALDPAKGIQGIITSKNLN